MYGSVFAVSIDYDPTVDSSPYGARIPGVWLLINDQNYDQNRLHLVLQDGDASNDNDLVYQDASITDTAFNLKMSEWNGKFEIRINDEVVHSKDQDTPTTFENVDAIIGQLHGWSSMASGWYKNFKLWTRC